jgi:hypothetical protein
MLRRRRYIDVAAGACVQFGWTEAIPLLQAICAKPDYLYQHREAYEARRALEGNPIPKELKDAEGIIWDAASQPAGSVDAEKVREAEATLVTAQDHEAAIVIAAWPAIARTKDREDFLRKTGLEILKQLPKPLAYDFVRQMANGIQDQNEHPDLARLEQALAPQH